MSAYARSMPNLGFDPAPGDVMATSSLARRQSEIAEGLMHVLAQVERIDLTQWQGRAGDATRMALSNFAPALRKAADAAQGVHAATSAWANQLSGFQAEADTLERQAAAASDHLQGLQSQPPPRPARLPAHQADLESASVNLAGIRSNAEELHQHYLAASRRTAQTVEEHESLWARTEPVRTILEAVLAPLDIVAADHWLDALKEIAGVPSEWIKEVDQSIETVKSLQASGKSATDALIEAGKVADSTASKLDAWEAFAPGWLKTAAGSIAGIKGLSYALGGLGVLADAGTVISPQDSGVMGNVDRGVAGVNGALLIANMATDEIPVVGEVTLAATGIYLGGDFLYHHFTPFKNICNDVGHGTVEAGDWVGKETSSAWHSVSSSVGSWF